MWTIEYTKRFLKDLNELSSDIKLRVETIVFEELETENPFELGYLEKMKGYSDQYKFRVGDYRVGLTLEKSTTTIVCKRVAHRREIYRIFP